MSTPQHDNDAQALLDLYDETNRIAAGNAARARAGTLTGADLERWTAAVEALGSACEAFRRCYYPRRFEVIAALGMVSVHSRTRRSNQIVYSAPAAVSGEQVPA